MEPKEVPLVIYGQDGVRRVVGTPKVELIGGDAVVHSSDITDPSMLKLFEYASRTFSFKIQKKETGG